MSSIVIDLETSGLPDKRRSGYGYEYYSPRQIEHYENSRIIEIAYAIIDNKTYILEKCDSLIIPDGFKIENTEFHGITEKMCIEDGVPIEVILNELKDNIEKYNVNNIISHNVKFDANILISECYRYNKSLAKRLYKCNKICTMENGSLFMGTRKWPKLEELYEYIFKKKIKQTHRALSDMDYCLECYVKMKESF